MFEFHRKQGSPATIAITTTPTPNEYGVVVLNGNHVYSFIEKPQGASPTNLISAGLYIFEPEVIKMTPDGYGRLELDVFPKLAASEDLSGYIFYGKWQDVRSQKTLEKALKW
jgi:NDP-sugar pyrophosphorylase family protein